LKYHIYIFILYVNPLQKVEKRLIYRFVVTIRIISKV
jgi:hypothetical protein